MPGTRYCARETYYFISSSLFFDPRIRYILPSQPPPRFSNYPFTIFVHLVRSSIFFLFLFPHCLGFSASYFALLRIILDRRRRRRDTLEWTGSIFGSRARDVGRMHLHLHFARKKRSVPILRRISVHVKSEINLDFIDIYIFILERERINYEKDNYDFTILSFLFSVCYFKCKYTNIRV